MQHRVKHRRRVSLAVRQQGAHVASLQCVGRSSAVRPHAGRRRLTHSSSSSELDDAALFVERLQAALEHNCQLLYVKIAGSLRVDDVVRRNRVRTARARAVVSCLLRATRTQLLTWPIVHAQLLDIALVLAAPLGFSAYVLCWIVDWLPFIERAHPALRKVRLFSGIVESIVRVKRQRTTSTSVSVSSCN